MARYLNQRSPIFYGLLVFGVLIAGLAVASLIAFAIVGDFEGAFIEFLLVSVPLAATYGAFTVFAVGLWRWLTRNPHKEH